MRLDHLLSKEFLLCTDCFHSCGWSVFFAVIVVHAPVCGCLGCSVIIFVCGFAFCFHLVEWVSFFCVLARCWVSRAALVCCSLTIMAVGERFVFACGCGWCGV